MQMQELDPRPLDERRAFGQWFMAKSLKVPDERWDTFENEVHSLLSKYTRQQQPVQAPQAPQPQVPWSQLQLAVQPNWLEWQPQPPVQSHEQELPPPEVIEITVINMFSIVKQYSIK